MPTYSVPIWVTITAPDQEIAWTTISDIVNMALSDALEQNKILEWSSGEPENIDG